MYKKHGFKNTRLYGIWHSMKQRCNNSNNKDYSIYKGMLCKEWNDFIPFKDWALDNNYSDDLKIERIKNSIGYNPKNCKWANSTIQVRNRGKFKNCKYKYVGIYKTISGKFASRINVNKNNINLGVYETPKLAAKARDNYIKDNNLEGYPLNFK